MNNCSYFIKDKALFGNYPSKEDINNFENMGVKLFVNLTCRDYEKLQDYDVSENSTKIDFYIKDRSYPKNIQTFSSFIIYLCDIINNLQNNEKIYIHCRGGHGRSGVVVACILCYLNNITPEESIVLTTKYHNQRTNLKEKWIKLGSPQTYGQKKFVMNLFKPIYFYKAYKSGPTIGLSNFSKHEVTTELGKFYNSEAAFHATKDPENVEYVQKLQNTQKAYNAKLLGNKVKPVDPEWEKNKVKIMSNILLEKVKQNDVIKETLLKSGLKPIIQYNKIDYFWGSGTDYSGENHIGKIWMQIRLKIFEKYNENKYKY